MISTPFGNRQILSISEGAPKTAQAGDLFVGVMPAKRYSTVRPVEHPVQSRKFTIHNSRDPTGNHITETIEFSDGTASSKFRIFTRAVKETGRIAPVFVRSYQHLSSASFDIKSDSSKSEHIIGSLNPDVEILVLGLFIENMNLGSTFFDHDDINVYPINFKEFKVILFWSRVNGGRSIQGGSLIPAHSIDPKTLLNKREQLSMNKSIDGLDSNEAIVYFRILRVMTIREYREILQYFENQSFGELTYTK